MRRKSIVFLLALLLVLSFGVEKGFTQTDPMPIRTLIPELDNTYDAGTAERSIRRLYIGSTDRYIDAYNKKLQFNPMDFALEDNLEITTGTSPGYEEDNNALSIVWADGETSPVMVTFRVPEDYNSGGAFRVCLDGSGTSTKNQVDFNVYVTTPGATWDASATNQTPVARTFASGSPEMVVLSVTTDFGSLAVGDIVVWRLWRDNVVTGIDDMEFFYGEFYYD